MNQHVRVDDASLAVRIGARLRALRRERELTLAALSARCGVSVSYLSAVEKGINHPSLRTLAAVTEALGVRIPDVLVEEGGVHVRHGRVPDGRRAVVPVSHSLLQLEGCLVVAAPGDTGRCPVALPGRDLFVYVVSGRVELDVDGRRVVLGPGDALDAAVPTDVGWTAFDLGTAVWTSCPARTD